MNKMPEELIAINIVIGDRSYRIKIDPAEEEFVRKALKKINDQILEYKTSFAGKDMQDYIAMVTIWFATQTPNQNTGQPDWEQLQSSLSDLQNL
jgi:cell division protein ZapA